MKKNPSMEVYTNQDSHLEGAQKAERQRAASRVTIYHTKEQRVISGNAAPLEKNLQQYLRKHPDCEVYDSGQHRVARMPCQTQMQTPSQMQTQVVMFTQCQPQVAIVQSQPQAVDIIEDIDMGDSSSPDNSMSMEIDIDMKIDLLDVEYVPSAQTPQVTPSPPENTIIPFKMEPMGPITEEAHFPTCVQWQDSWDSKLFCAAPTSCNCGKGMEQEQNVLIPAVSCLHAMESTFEWFHGFAPGMHGM